jgi:hypothetical protein
MAEAASADTSKTAAADQTSTPPKADAGGGGTMLDKVLSSLDSLHGRMDGFEKFMNNSKKADEFPPEDKEAAGENKSVTDKKRKDSAEADAAKKADWDDEDEKKKDSAAKADGKRKDAGGGFQNEGEEGKEPPKDPNWNKKDKKSDEAAPATKTKVDSKKADEDEDEEKKDSKSKADAAKEDSVAKEDARADDYVRVKATDWQHVNDQLASIHSFVNRPDEDRAKFADAQARADSIYGAHGKRAPQPLPGEGLIDYRKRLATPFRQYSATWKDEKLSAVPDSVFEKIEGAIYADAMKAAENPPDLGAGELRKRVITDEDTGFKKIEWLGNTSFIKEMSQTPRRVAGFRQRNA